MKTQEFLAAANIEPKTQVNAKKETLQKAGALKLVKSCSHLLVAKGKKVVAVDLKKAKPSEAEILSLILGPTGNLRAPTIKVGSKLVVGFNDEMYADVFG